MASLLAIFGTCKEHVYTSKRNVPLSETTVRMGHSTVIYCHWKKKTTTKKLALPDISYFLSEGRYLIHICIVRKELMMLMMLLMLMINCTSCIIATVSLIQVMLKIND